MTQLLGGQVPAGRRKVAQPLQWPLEHQLRLAGAQSLHIDGQVAVLRIEHVRRTQLNQAYALGQGTADAGQQLARRQAIRGDQVALGQARGGDYGFVGGGELVVQQLPLAGPGQRLTLGTMRLATEGRDLPDVQQHLLVRIVVANLDQRARRLRANAQFLLQFARERSMHGFALFHLATGELPEPALVFVLGSPGEQDASIDTPNHCCCDMHTLHPLTSCNAA